VHVEVAGGTLLLGLREVLDVVAGGAGHRGMPAVEREVGAAVVVFHVLEGSGGVTRLTRLLQGFVGRIHRRLGRHSRGQPGQDRDRSHLTHIGISPGASARHPRMAGDLHGSIRSSWVSPGTRSRIDP